MNSSEEGTDAIPMATTPVDTTTTTPKDRSDSHSSCDSSCGVTTGHGNSNTGSGNNSRKNSLTARTVGSSKGGNGGKSSSGKKVSGEAYIEGDIKLRFLCPEDVEAVKKLCRDWFPVE